MPEKKKKEKNEGVKFMDAERYGSYFEKTAMKIFGVILIFTLETGVSS